MDSSRYAELARLLTREIATGAIPVGSQLPNEVELALQYQVSRTTVRSALNVLEGMGLISRKRRRGTRVESAEPAKAYTRSVTTLEDLMQYAEETQRLVEQVSTVVCDASLAERLGCRRGDTWMRVDMLRIDPSAPTLPICATQVYLEPSVGEQIAHRVSEPGGLIHDMIESVSGRFVISVAQDIRAIVIPPDLVERLNVPPASVALEITRHYKDQVGATCQITISTHPADRFTYHLDLNRHVVTSFD